MSDVIIIGAGPAGLATSHELTRRGIDHVVLERGEIGQTWSSLYDSLILHTGKHLSSLPGMRFPRRTPLFPSRRDFLGYLRQYAARFRLPIETGVNVAAVVAGRAGWHVETSRGAPRPARAVVVATGIVANPQIPATFLGGVYRGTLMHSVEYRRPDGFGPQRVLVVGAGNSAGEIAAELAAAGSTVTLAVRSGATTVPLRLFGVPVQYFAVALSHLPRGLQVRISDATARASAALRGPAVLPPPRADRCVTIPLIGFHLVDAIRSGRVRVKGAVIELTAGGARFADGTEKSFDAIILATGYRPALGILGAGVRLDSCGFAIRRDRVTSADQHNLFFAGHNYDMRGGLRNIALDARLLGGLIGKHSKPSPPAAGGRART